MGFLGKKSYKSSEWYIPVTMTGPSFTVELKLAFLGLKNNHYGPNQSCGKLSVPYEVLNPTNRPN